MTLRTRKLIVVSLIASVTVLASTWAIASWLADVGVVGWVTYVRSEYLTGAAVAVIAALLFLLGSPAETRSLGVPKADQCRVCDQLLVQLGRYCAACGSRVDSTSVEV